MVRVTRSNATVGRIFKPYQKIGTTMMTRMHGPFRCETREGPVDCEDGWLALDAEGYPYPVAASIAEKSYEPLPERIGSE